MDVMDGFPVGTTGGGDFLTGLPAREFTVVNEHGAQEVRQERVVMTEKMFQWGDPPPQPGRVGFSELTIMRLAMAVGMVPESTLEAVRGLLAKMTEERDQLSTQLAAALREVELLRGQTEPRVVYVTEDGREYGSKPAMLKAQMIDRPRSKLEAS